jgi:hypothetical protein
MGSNFIALPDDAPASDTAGASLVRDGAHRLARSSFIEIATPC